MYYLRAGKSTTVKSTYFRLFAFYHSGSLLINAPPPVPVHPCPCHTDFQLAYAHNAWLEERASWRSVILLNLVKSVNTILDVLSKEMRLTSSPSIGHLRLPPTSPTSSQTSDEDEDEGYDFEPNPAPALLRPGSASPPIVTQDIAMYPVRSRMPRAMLTEKHRLLQMRLKPLRRVQNDLEKIAGSPVVR